MISTLVELAGFACLVAAAWLWCPLVGLLAAGLVLLLLGYLLGDVRLTVKAPMVFGRRRGGDA